MYIKRGKLMIISEEPTLDFIFKRALSARAYISINKWVPGTLTNYKEVV
jgi:ribosomal protein S2